MTSDLFNQSGATIIGLYRYNLWRTWGPEQPMCFIGLNPSTADETQDDPTIRRVIGFAKREGCGGLIMVNLFAFRSTDPKHLLKVWNPVGEENPQYIRDAMEQAKLTVAGWGAHKMVCPALLKFVLPQDAQYWCLGTTSGGHPRHPLYLKREAVLRPWAQNDPLH